MPDRTALLTAALIPATAALQPLATMRMPDEVAAAVAHRRGGLRRVAGDHHNAYARLPALYNRVGDFGACGIFDADETDKGQPEGWDG